MLILRLQSCAEDEEEEEEEGKEKTFEVQKKNSRGKLWKHHIYWNEEIWNAPGPAALSSGQI